MGEAERPTPSGNQHLIDPISWAIRCRFLVSQCDPTEEDFGEAMQSQLGLVLMLIQDLGPL